MSRRRKKNPLLMRIVVVTVVVHIIALPIAAHFGAFEKLKRQFGEARVTLVNLPKEEKEKPAKKAEKAKEKPKVAKSSGKSVAKKSGAIKLDPSRQKVIAVNNPGEDGPSDGPTIVQGDNTKVGEVPPAKLGDGVKKETGEQKPHEELPTKVVEPKPPVEPPKITKAVEVPKPKHIPVYAEPEQEYSPQPSIPDDMRNEVLEKNFVVLFTVGPDGKPTDLKVLQSTGSQELDAVALKTAKQWRFKPATLDGVGVEGKVKLTIEFRVE